MFSGFSREQLSIIKKLDTPKKIQDFLETIRANFGDTFFSPKKVLEERKAHCIEGAIFAAAVLRFHGHKPLLVDLEATMKDVDHVIAVFKQKGCWGAITKTNHAVLRYRDPVFKSIRELVMSFFNEYFLEDGKKTLRTYSEPVDLSRFDKFNWMTSDDNLDFITEYLERIPHKTILTREMITNLRKADKIEIEASNITQWKK